MTDQFQPGDMVECVDAAPMAQAYPAGLIVGALYTVRDIYLKNVFADGSEKAGCGLVLEEPSAAWTTWCGLPGGWNAVRFRKIYRPSADLIAKLLAEPVLPDAPKVKERVR
jgi:hypothetical protein